MSLRNDPAIRLLILDMDGVLWRDNQPIGDLPSIFDQIRQKGLQVCLATNNATLSAEHFQLKLSKMGVDVDVTQIVNSAEATAQYLNYKYPTGGPVYIIGENGLVETLRKHGFYQSEEAVIAVVVAMDRHFTYEKMSKAAQFVRSGVPFIGTNPDRTFPTPDGFMPGAGSIIAAVEAASNVQPTIIGKPQPAMYQLVLDRMGIRPEESLAIGDRLDTDIAGGQNAGCYTGLVLSGVTDERAAYKWRPIPDFIERDLSSLVEKL